MKKHMFRLVVLVVVLFSFATVNAHFMWINITKSVGSSQIISFFGFGHALPMEDFLATEVGTIELATFELIGPDASRTTLKAPNPEMHDSINTSSGLVARSGDLGAYSFSYDKDSVQGTYQLAAASKYRYFAQYIDKKGQTRLARKPLNEINDPNGIETVVRALRISYLSKAYVTVGKWTTPNLVGHLAEIVSDTDLHTVRPGDMVRFRLLFDGKPIYDPSGLQTLDFLNSEFGANSGPDAHHISSYVSDGKAQFRVPNSGQWLVSALVRRDVASEPSLEELRGKVLEDAYYATLTFNVSP